MPPKKRRSHFEHLKKTWSKRQKHLHQKIWADHHESLTWLQKSSTQFMLSSLASLIMMAQPTLASVEPVSTPQKDKAPKEISVDKKQSLIQDLKSVLPEEVVPLTEDQEQKVEHVLLRHFHIPVKAVYEGKRLNRSYGLIGAEQHLMRYPGDTMATHFQTPAEETFAPSGMAPGRGAWGYFAPSYEALTQKDIEREKYYIAAPTFLAPGFNENVNEYYMWFKYRKMLVVNPENGKAMVVCIGDAGPAEFTGKHLGGSPEVMRYLERVNGGQKGPVLYYFIDDPEDKIPLGPVEL